MRIALVITELDPGGAENCLTQLACHLANPANASNTGNEANAVNEVRVYAIGPPPAAGHDHLVKLLQSRNIPVEICIPAGGRRSLLAFPSQVKWLRQHFRQFEPDVVQSMLFHGNLLAALAIDPARSRLFGGVRVRQLERFRWWLQRWAARKMQKLICVSDDVARHCIENERIPADKVITIPNGIDLATVQRAIADSKRETWAKFGLPANARVILFVGRLHPQKGVEQLVRRANNLLRELPDHHLVLIGSGPLESRLKALAASNSATSQTAGNRIHFVGWQPDALTWMHRAELLLLPAVYEGMPNVILEAMAVGLPFVAFDIDGIRQLLGDKADATLQIVAPGDFDRFESHAITLLESAPLRSACTKLNQLRIQQHFQLSHQLEKYRQLYLLVAGC